MPLDKVEAGIKTTVIILFNPVPEGVYVNPHPIISLVLKLVK